MADMRIGVDLGGTKIEAIALDDDGIVLGRHRIPTPRGDYQGTLAAITGLVADLEGKLARRGSVGIGVPGVISPATGQIKNANSTWLNGQPFDRDLAAAIGRPVRVANDANCFALSEAVDGAARGESLVFGVILGTGVGGGIAFKEQAITGRNAIAGEWGHNPLPWPREDEWPGPQCYCGLSGCIETLLSGPGLARDHAAAGGQQITAHEVARLAAEGDALAEATLQRYEDRLTRALAGVINVLDPDVVVLGGGLSNLTRLYEAVRKRLPDYVFSDRVDTVMAPPVHGDSSGVRGAAWLWPRQRGSTGDVTDAGP